MLGSLGTGTKLGGKALGKVDDVVAFFRKFGKADDVADAGKAANKGVSGALSDSNVLKVDIQLFAKKSDIKQIESIAQKYKMNSTQRREYGDYVESLKDLVPNDKNFTWKELEKIAEEYLGGR